MTKKILPQSYFVRRTYSYSGVLSGKHLAEIIFLFRNIFCLNGVLSQENILTECHFIRKTSCNSVNFVRKIPSMSLYSENSLVRRRFFFRKIPTSVTLRGKHTGTLLLCSDDICQCHCARKTVW